jgi:hypothetical protein
LLWGALTTITIITTTTSLLLVAAVTYFPEAFNSHWINSMVNFRDASDWKPWQRSLAAASKVFGLHNVFTAVPCSQGTDGELEEGQNLKRKKSREDWHLHEHDLQLERHLRRSS